MKKLFTLFLVLAGCVGTASAADDIYLRSDFNGTNNWNEDNAAMKFTFEETNSSNEDVYTYNIDASDVRTSDIWFRLHISGWGAQICPYTSNGSYTFAFSNGQNETYGAKYERTYFQGSDLSFGISHSTIKASQYKITVFRGNNDTNYENEDCKVMWIKVEIVSMPATINPALGFATFSCDRALDLSGVVAYYASGVTNGKVVLTKTTGKVPAGTGLLLAGSGDVTIPVVATDDATALSGNLLKASVTETQVAASTNGAYHYFLAGTGASDLGFYNIATATASGAGKAYLETTEELESEGAGARAAWVFQDETQGINSVENAQNADVIYDLQGRVVKTAKAGLYIKNGKKVLVK